MGQQVIPVTSVATLFRKYWRMGWEDKKLIAEALVALTFSSCAIALLPYRIVVLLAAWQGLPRPVTEIERELIRRRVRWAILACERRLPWKAVCFQQGLAAHWVLRRHGVMSTLHYGVAPDRGSGLRAHV